MKKSLSIILSLLMVMTTLFAVPFTAKAESTYTVEFDANVPATASTTVTGSMEAQSFAYSEKKALSGNGYSLPGYEFNGWNTKADGSGTSYADEAEVQSLSEDGGTVTLYAQWSGKPYTIEYWSDAEGRKKHVQTAYFDRPGKLDTYSDRAFSWESGGKTLHGWSRGSLFIEDGDDFVNLCGAPDADGNVADPVIVADWVSNGQIVVSVTKDNVPQEGLEAYLDLRDGYGREYTGFDYDNGKYVFHRAPSEDMYEIYFNAPGYPTAYTTISYSENEAVSVVFDYYTVTFAKDPAYSDFHDIALTGDENDFKIISILGQITAVTRDGVMLDIETKIVNPNYSFVGYTAVGVTPGWENNDPTKANQTIEVRGKADITPHVKHEHSYNYTYVDDNTCKGVCACGAEITQEHYDRWATKCGHQPHCENCDHDYGTVPEHEMYYNYKNESGHKPNCYHCDTYFFLEAHSGGTATCTAKAVCEKCGHEYGEVDADAHDWAAPTYVWSADNKTVTATRICTRDASHKEDEIGNATYEITKPATCTEQGEITYTATFTNAAFETQTRKVAMPPNDHSWKTEWSKDGTNHWHDCNNCTEIKDKAPHNYGEVSYEWTGTASVKATRVCADCSYEDSETVNTTSEQTKAPTCTVKGETTYTATFTNAAFETQTKTEANIDELGHKYGTEGDSRFTCTVCGTVDETLKTKAKATQEKAEAEFFAGINGASSDDGDTISWTPMQGAVRYDIYATYCAKKKYKKVKTVSGSTTTVKLTKLFGKKLKKNKNVKFYIVAYKNVNGKDVKLSTSPTFHIAGKKTKYTNVKKIKVKKNKFNLSAGKTAKIKASLVLENKKKKPIKHVAKFRYVSSNTAVATVSKSGRIKAVGNGTATVYVFSNNGTPKAIKVTVK